MIPRIHSQWGLTSMGLTQKLMCFFSHFFQLPLLEWDSSNPSSASFSLSLDPQNSDDFYFNMDVPYGLT